jgi:signal transduction histidine kinase
MNVDDLRPLFVFGGLSDEQLAELLAAGEEVRFEPGIELFHEGERATAWWVLVDGSIELVRRAGREEAVVMMTMDRPGQWAGGFSAWDDESSYLATARSASSGRLFRVPSESLGKLARAWFPFGVHLIAGFFQTVRRMDTMSRQRAALIALGELAARLAHEINNPASAAARAVDALEDANDTLFSSLTRLVQESLTAAQLMELDALRREIDTSSSTVDPLTLADKEDALLEWLDTRNVDNGWQIAPPLAAAGVDVQWCERVAAALDGGTLGPGLQWIASTLATRALLSEMQEATTRISALLDAVKSYSQVDRATMQLVDVTEGIESTIVILGHKLGEGITVVRDYAPDAPRIEGNPGELNQVWTNLIDNALDALDGSGTLRISTRADGSDFVVEIADTGPGMAPEVQARAFEPFFTTKELGKGTGLGLDIARRIVVDRHHGRITVASRPGETVLSVYLPRGGEAS